LEKGLGPEKSEKAAVGGSTPSSKGLSQILSVIPVRSESAFLDTPKMVAVAASC